MFARTEQAHNYLLCAGAVRIHRVDSDVAHRHADRQQAIAFLVEYAERMNALLAERVGFKPFTPDRRGFTGRRQPLEPATGVWLMRGLGFGSGG